MFFGAFTLLPPIKLLTPTLPWFTFDRLQPCLTLTHSQPRSRLFNCLVLSLVHIHSRCSSSLSSSPLHRRSFSPRVGCGGASVCRDSARKKKKGGCVGRRGGASRVCLLSPRCKLTQKKTLSRSVGCLSWLPFPPPRSLSHQSSDQRSLTRVARRGGNRGVGGAFLFKLSGNNGGPSCPRHPQLYAPANQPSMLMWLWRVETKVLSV